MSLSVSESSSFNEWISSDLSSIIVGDLRTGSKAAYKGSDQSKSTTTLGDDNDLAQSLEAGKTYRFKFPLFVNNASGVEGLKVALDGTATFASLKARVIAYDGTLKTTAQVDVITAFGSAVSMALSAGDNHVDVEGTIEVTTGGTFKLQWAQGAGTGVNPTTVKRNSALELTNLTLFA